MGKITGFLEFDRKTEEYAPVEERVKHFKEFTIPLKEKEMKEQGARCMDCGIPFCHSGCPLGNLIPDFNDAVYKGKWDKASQILHATNNFPEFTGRLCPAPCEEACVLGINEDPVSIENIEKSIAETAFKNGWIIARPPEKRTGKRVAVIGSGWLPHNSSIGRGIRLPYSSATRNPGGCCVTESPTLKWKSTL